MVTAAQANARLIAEVDSEKDNAKLGSYDLEVSASGRTMTISIVVAGPTTQVEVTGDAMIDVTSGWARTR